ncbi:MAG: filamentous hemagglutinin N-terminal domain-containing protein [Alphaproteobacteria bacterium]|nr:filamentous hemagglutinin N-terminal domain-containing protein [Alphaproteobacteria bacterium]
MFNSHKNLMRIIKSCSFFLSFFFLLGGDVLASELPIGGIVKSGEASINQGRDFIKVNQYTDKTIIDWSSFDVGQNKLVEFVQPRTQSQSLNRVLGSTPSTIAGRIKANGQIFLVNPNGILITENGLINTNSFSASTLDISNEDFKRGELSFVKQSGKAGAVVTNNGSIAVNDGGFVALLGGAIDNGGVVTAHLSKVGFGAGEKVILNIGDSEFLRVEIPTSNLNTIRDVNGIKLSEIISVNNGGKVISYGGLVKLSVGTVRKTLRRVINIRGLVQAKSVSSSDRGKIIISGPDVSLNGTVDVSSDVINVKGGDVNITSTSYTQTGLIDASGKAPASSGGAVSISSNSDINIFAKSNILSDGNGDGGIIRINTGSKRLITQGKISASGFSGRGGLIDISTDNGNIIVMDGTKIIATGYRAGGLIRIGGEFGGGNLSEEYDENVLTGFRDRWTSVFGDNLLNLPTSYKTSLGYDALVDASSVNGDGGTVVLWSNGVTQQFGNIKANGFNDGGWVQVFGKKSSRSYKFSKVEVSGQSFGTVLLDPKNLLVSKMKNISYLNLLFRYKKENKLHNYDYFNSSVSLVADDTGDYKLAVGAYGDSKYRGSVYLFNVDNLRNGLITYVDKIGKKQLNLNPESRLHNRDNFGSSVSLIGNDADGYKLAVGAYGINRKKGAVYLFDLSEFRNGQVRYVDKIGKKQLNLNPESRLHFRDYFGSSVSLIGSDADGYKLAVGAYGINRKKGAVYLFDLPEFRNGQVRYIDKIKTDQLFLKLKNRLNNYCVFNNSRCLVSKSADNYELTEVAQENNDITSKTTLGTENELISFNSDIASLIQNISNNNNVEINMWGGSNEKELIINDDSIINTNDDSTLNTNDDSMINTNEDSIININDGFIINTNEDTTIKANNYKYKSKTGLQKFDFMKTNRYKITDSENGNVKKKIKYIKKKEISNVTYINNNLKN